MLSIGTGEGPPDLKPAIRLADRYGSIYATVGHPPAVRADTYSDDHIRRWPDLLRHPKCVAVGEIGLDYYWKPYDEAQQADVFHRADAGSPRMRGSRSSSIRATRGTTRSPCCVSTGRRRDSRAFMHCFTGGIEQARQALDLGFYISFAGSAHVSESDGLYARPRQRWCPLDRLLVETDAPYLAPCRTAANAMNPHSSLTQRRKLAEVRGEEPARPGCRRSRRTSKGSFACPRVLADKPISYTEGFE